MQAEGSIRNMHTFSPTVILTFHWRHHYRIFHAIHAVSVWHGLATLGNWTDHPRELHSSDSFRPAAFACVCVFCLHVLCCVACSQLNVTYCCTSKNNNRKHRSIFECWAACNDVGCVDCSLLSGEYEPEMVVTCPDELNTAFLLALSCLPHLLPHILKENSFLFSVSAATPLKS